MIARLRSEAREFGVALDDEACSRFGAYLELLLEASRHQNLTALRTAEAVVDRLFLDALAGVSLLGDESGDVIDVGSGGGIPGLVLAIAFPHRRIVLLDANQKKVTFLREVASKLALDAVEVRNARAEDVARDPAAREQFGVATAKAVAHLRVLVEWLVPLVRSDGLVLCWKGPAARTEIDEATAALAALGATVARVVPYRLPDSEERFLVCVRRVGDVDVRWPRRAGMALKRPLIT